MKKLITICLVTAMFIVGNNPSFADPVVITLKSDASTLAAALGPGSPPPDVLARLDTPDISGLAFQPVLVGSYGTYTPVPPGAPPDTAVVNIPPGDGENGYFMMTFQLPDVFDNMQLTGVANVDDFGRVFLNGHPLTAPIGSGVSEFGNVAFGTSDPSLFQTGENTVLISVANTGSGPSGGAFFVNITSGEEGFKISGKVTAQTTGLPIANIWVDATDYETGNWFDGENTDSNGFYEITNLATGTYRVRASGGSQYASEYYNNQLSWDWATPVNVSASQQTTGIDFSLEPGASISGVVKNSSGIGQANVNVNVNCWANDGYGIGDWTDANGFYECDGLPVGYSYNVVAYPPPDSNYMITRITVDVYQPGEYTDQDIILGEGGLKISGRVTDKATTLPLADVSVGLWNDDFEIWTDTRTDVNGIYALTNLPPGGVEIQVRPESPYAWTGTEIELTEDINNLNFALPVGAILCGKVLDSKTAEPLAGVEIEYWSGRYAVNRNLSTDADGTFCLTQLPPGIAEVKAKPDVDMGYSWNLPWASDLVCLGEGENRSGRIIALEKGALVRGYIKDANGNAISGIENDYSGRDCGGWCNTDVNGFYQIRLPVGIYAITLEDTDEFGALPAIVTITDINEDVNVPDTIVYTEEDGGQIYGEVNNPSDYSKTGCFLIIAFEAGTTLSDPNTWYTIQPVSETEMENAGPFSLAKLPPDVNYDIYLCVESETPDEIMSLAVQDSALNVAVGTTGIMLEYNSEGSTVRGGVKNIDDRAVLGATVLLSDSSSSFGGFGETDCNGEYIIYNVPAGTYTATAVHSKYLNTLTTVEVADGILVDVNTIIMPFAGEKEGADLNGDGVIDILDVAEFSEMWLESGLSEADFNQDSRVNFNDWARMAENWLGKAIWYQE